jgi:C4-dicarboxylate-specific signal transduction histidine kinase
LHCETRGKSVFVTGDRAALKHALAEVLLNALQANPKEPKVDVTLRTEGDNRRQDLQIEVQDNGAGFTAEAAKQAPAPFFTTRNVGLGLGLTVSRKIVETHHGKLEIIPPQSGKSGVVRISLPVETGAAATE